MAPDQDKKTSDPQQIPSSTPDKGHPSVNAGSTVPELLDGPELTKYRETVEICAQLRLDSNLPNGDANNAAILFSTFFKFAEREVCIFTGQLFGGVFDVRPDVGKRAIDFLRKDSNNVLRIAVSDKVDLSMFRKKPFIAGILKEDDIKGRLFVYDVSGKTSSNHFSVMDEVAFRYETSHVQKHAIANFGNSNKAEQYYRDFESIIRDTQKMNLESSMALPL